MWALVLENLFSNNGWWPPLISVPRNINKTHQIGHCHLEYSYGMTLASCHVSNAITSNSTILKCTFVSSIIGLTNMQRLLENYFRHTLQWHIWRGARWLSGRVSDSGARGPGFETYLRRVVSLSKTLYSPKVLVNYPGSDGSVPTWLKNCWLGR